MAVVAASAAAMGLSGCGGHLTPLDNPSPPGATPTDTDAGAGHHRVHGLFAIHDPGEVTGTLTGPCRTRHHGELPDRSCTPGAIDPAVTQANIGSTICRSGYTTTVRPPESQTEKFKWDVAEPAYGQHNMPGELDHEVPLELGGANDARNLWVEAGSIPNPKDAVEGALSSPRSRSTSKSAGQYGADASVTNIKDVLERRLNLLVCRGKVSLADAQTTIARNWITAYERWVGPLP
jgi:hypothetical protein